MVTLRLLALFSALVSQTRAGAPHAHRDLHRRTLPGNWTSYGCWTDNVGNRTLSSASYANATSMTVESCINFCSTAYIFSGLEYGSECYCGNSLAGSTNVSMSNCDMACSGNPQESCGAGNLLNVYWNGTQPPAAPVTVQSVGNWTLLGCYNDSVTQRTLEREVSVSYMTVESCTTACRNTNTSYTLAGVEYGDQCFCGSNLDYGSTRTPQTDCNMTCAGNSSEYCGGSNRLGVYNYTAGQGTASSGGGGTTGGGGNSVTGIPLPVTTGLSVSAGVNISLAATLSILNTPETTSIMNVISPLSPGR